MTDDDKINVPSIRDVLKGINMPAFSMPDLKLPEVSFPVIEMPTHEERNEYASSRILLQRLAERLRLWREKLPTDVQPVVLAILSNGVSINVRGLEEEGHNGVVIKGDFKETDCLVLAHQSTVQLLCVLEKVAEPKKMRKIGFLIDGEEFEG